MNKNTKRGLIIGGAFLLIFAILYNNRFKIKTKLYPFITNIIYKKQSASVFCKGCALYFPDNVKTQAKAYAQKGAGIQPQENIAGLKRFVKKGQLVPVETSDYYDIAYLSHSYPYVRPIVNEFLNNLSSTYEEECNEQNIGYWPFTIVSLTRTIESVKDLKGDNGNAIENSAHLRGKTLDINIYYFRGNQKNLNAFVTALRKLRDNKRCYVKFESTGCLHITVR